MHTASDGPLSVYSCRVHHLRAIHRQENYHQFVRGTCDQLTLNHEVIDRVKEGRILECPDLRPASVYDIMKACWVRVPSKRSGMEGILSRIQQLIGHNAEFKDRYATITPASVGYVNLAVGMAADSSELEESRRVSEPPAMSSEPNEASNADDTSIVDNKES